MSPTRSSYDTPKLTHPLSSDQSPAYVDYIPTLKIWASLDYTQSQLLDSSVNNITPLWEGTLTELTGKQITITIDRDSKGKLVAKDSSSLAGAAAKSSFLKQLSANFDRVSINILGGGYGFDKFCPCYSPTPTRLSSPLLTRPWSRTACRASRARCSLRAIFLRQCRRCFGTSYIRSFVLTHATRALTMRRASS